MAAHGTFCAFHKPPEPTISVGSETMVEADFEFIYNPNMMPGSKLRVFGVPKILTGSPTGITVRIRSNTAFGNATGTILLTQTISPLPTVFEADFGAHSFASGALIKPTFELLGTGTAELGGVGVEFYEVDP